MTMIHTLEDVTLVPTPVTYTSFGGLGRPETRETRDELRARLFQSDTRLGRPITIVLSTAYGDPVVKHVALRSALIRPRPSPSPWAIWLAYREPRHRVSNSFERNFPTDCLLLAWGHHPVALDDLPASETTLRWHSVTFAPVWRTVAARLHQAAGAEVWLDTTEAALAHRAARAATKEPR
jgi:hypothetical protein